MASLYLHIPFCRSKCLYCSFNSCIAGKELYAPYIAALIRELTSLVNNLAETGAEENSRPVLDTLFIGGGTPTCLPSELLQGLLLEVFKLFDIATGAEISVEANPGTVDLRSLSALRDVGVNRLSLGVQSFADRELELIGRIHNGQEACSAIEAARAAGFDNINLDLMYGLPGQTPDSWQSSLERGLSFRPEHLSLYQLTVEEDTPFQVLVENQTLCLPAEDHVLQMDDITQQLCGAADMHQYETSNYAAPERKCRHNINYWLNNDYLAAGASAVSCLHGMRERRLADPSDYVRRISRRESVVMERECLPLEASFRETVIMGLRMVRGVSRKSLQARYGLDVRDHYGATLVKLIDAGLVELTETHLRITAKGWPLANQIMAELV